MDKPPVVRWDECAWQPHWRDPSKAPKTEVHGAIDIGEVKGLLRRLTSHPDSPPGLRAIAEAAVAVIVHLETQKNEALLRILTSKDLLRPEDYAALKKLLGRCREVPLVRQVPHG